MSIFGCIKKIVFHSRLRLWILLVFLPIFYSYLHSNAYRILYYDKTFHGVGSEEINDPNEIAKQFNSMNAYAMILSDKRITFNTTHCISIKIVAERVSATSRYRILFLFSFLDNLHKQLNVVTFSPLRNINWNIESQKCTTMSANTSFILGSELDSVAVEQMQYLLSSADDCVQPGCDTTIISIVMQPINLDIKTDTPTIHIEKTVQYLPSEKTYCRDTIVPINDLKKVAPGNGLSNNAATHQ